LKLNFSFAIVSPIEHKPISQTFISDLKKNKIRLISNKAEEEGKGFISHSPILAFGYLYANLYDVI